MTIVAPELEKRIQQQMDHGSYGSSDEVLADALAALEARNADFEIFRAGLNAKLDASVAAAARGETISAEQLESELDAWEAQLSTR